MAELFIADPPHYRQVILRCLEDLAGRIERQERLQLRFEKMQDFVNAAGCGRAVAELSVVHSLLDQDFKGLRNKQDIPQCTREQPHEGPCNGWPCDWALGAMSFAEALQQAGFTPVGGKPLVIEEAASRKRRRKK